MKGEKGFTLVELVVVIIIVGILSISAVPIYNGYTRRAYAAEGRALLGSILTAEGVYYSECGNYATEAANTSKGTALDIDARKNKYFRTFKVDGGGDTFTAIISGSGAASAISLTLVQPSDSEPVIYENSASGSGSGGGWSGGGASEANPKII